MKPSRRRFKTVLITAVAVGTTTLGAALTVPSVAHASIRHCATAHDFNQVRRGQTVPRVERLLHQRSYYAIRYRLRGSRNQERFYRTCTPYGDISVEFRARPDTRLRAIRKAGTFIS